MRRLTLALLIASLPFTALAQDKPRYGTWQSDQDQVQTLAEELLRLVDEAARARAADPRFLDDLRALADKYVNPWPHLLVQEDFANRDFTANPAWTVASGQFDMDWQGVLYSKIEAPAASEPQSAQPEPQRKVRGEDFALQLLGQILNQGQGNRRQEASPRSAAPAAPPPAIPAEAYLQQPISNAFSLDAKLAMENTADPATLAVFQGQQRTAGYFLTYDPIAGLELQRRGASGAFTLATSTGTLADSADHTPNWTRSANRKMVVSIDDTEVLRATDTGFRDDWAGVTWVNGGGAMTLRALSVSGTR